MADVIQAAKWMQEGHKVKRSGWVKTSRGFDMVVGKIGPRAQTIYSFSRASRNMKAIRVMKLDDLLAEDWEIAHG